MGHQQMFHLSVTISATQACESDDLRDVAIFSFSIFFFGRAKNFGICEAMKDSSGASFQKQGK